MSDSSTQIDSTIEVVTPENIAFQYQVAGPFRRLLAFSFDVFVQLLVIGIVYITLSIFAASLLGMAGVVVTGALIAVFGFVLGWFYGGLFETFWNGQTPGKWLVGIRVLTVQGRPINGMQAVLRNIFRFVDLMPAIFMLPDQIPIFPGGSVIPTCVLGLFVMTMNRRFQRVGDLVCGTMVVREEKSWLMGVAKLEDPRAVQLAEYLPPTYEVSRSLAKALATYVESRKFFSQPRRREIARHLAEPLLVEFELPSDTSHDLLLCALYHRTFIAELGVEGGMSSSPFATPSNVVPEEGIQFVPSATLSDQTRPHRPDNPYSPK